MLQQYSSPLKISACACLRQSSNPCKSNVWTSLCFCCGFSRSSEGGFVFPSLPSPQAAGQSLGLNFEIPFILCVTCADSVVTFSLCFSCKGQTLAGSCLSYALNLFLGALSPQGSANIAGLASSLYGFSTQVSCKSQEPSTQSPCKFPANLTSLQNPESLQTSMKLTSIKCLSIEGFFHLNEINLNKMPQH